MQLVKLYTKYAYYFDILFKETF